MSNENHGEKGRVQYIVEQVFNGGPSNGHVGRLYDDEERDKVSKQFNRKTANALPKSAPRLEEEGPINAPRIRTRPQTDVNMDSVPDDEVTEDTSTASSPVEVAEFNEADYPPADCSIQTALTENDESEECNESQSEVEAVNPQPLGEEKVTDLEKKMVQATTARDGTRDDIKEIKERLQSKEKELKQLQDQVDQLFLERNRDTIQTRRLLAKIDALTSKIEAIEARERILNERLVKREERIRTLEKQLEQARQEHEALAEQRRADQVAHREELQEQKLAQMREMDEALELIYANKRQALRDECQSGAPESRSEFSLQQRADFGDGYNDDARWEGMFGRADGMTLREQLQRRREADIEDEYNRRENQRSYQLHPAHQQSQRKQLTMGFDLDDDDMRPRLSSTRTHRRSGSDNDGGKNMKLSRPKRDRTKMSVTKR